MSAQLDQHKWQDRIILIFANQANQANYQTQMDNLQADSAGLKDRDLVLYSLFQNNNNDQLSEEQQAALWKKYNPESASFLCVLIGKDGFAKAKKTNVFLRQEIFDLIDSMPMRQAEMRRKAKDDGGR